MYISDDGMMNVVIYLKEKLSKVVLGGSPGR